MAEEVYDLVCVGFGPAALAIAVALEDARYHFKRCHPNVCFLEKQETFRWHAGMMIPGSKMQISFLKDMATFRDPQSHFTFLHYLYTRRRLSSFANLGTFLPDRLEFEDYLKWCASHFTDQVRYGQEVTSILAGTSGPVIDHFTVESTDPGGRKSTLRTRNVVLSVGGRPNIPASFPQHPSILHSSQYISQISRVLPDQQAPHSIAIIGSGQSAAEIFHDLHTRYPHSRAYLIFRDTALKPSDDSPFVNEAFDPDRVVTFYSTPEADRKTALASIRATNYSVVRLELLEQIYRTQYLQRITQPDSKHWQHRILPSRTIASITTNPLTLHLQPSSSPNNSPAEPLPISALIAATGYTRSAHTHLLRNLTHLSASPNDNDWKIQRDYSLALDATLVSPSCGIYIQGGAEATHGISDTLLSILATRSGELVGRIFGDWMVAQAKL